MLIVGVAIGAVIGVSAEAALMTLTAMAILGAILALSMRDVQA